MPATLAIIDVNIQSGQDESAREVLVTRLEAYKGDSVKPLWINLLRERADLRVVCLVRDMSHFDDFLIDEIRTVPGVRATEARLVFGGMARAELITELPLQEAPQTRRAAASVFLQTQPGRDREAYEALVHLPPHREVSVVWILKVFHSPHADIKVLLLGERTSALTGFVMSWIRTIPGIVDSEVVSVLDWRILATPEDFIELAETFPERQ